MLTTLAAWIRSLEHPKLLSARIGAAVVVAIYFFAPAPAEAIDVALIIAKLLELDLSSDR